MALHRAQTVMSGWKSKQSLVYIGERMLLSMNSSDCKANHTPSPIKLVGIGGMGRCAVERVTATPISGVEAIVIDTDAQELRISHCTRKIQIDHMDRSVGMVFMADSGGIYPYHDSPQYARQRTEAHAQEIIDALHGARAALLVAGMGGRTGTDLIAVVANLAQEAGIPVACVVNKPLPWEGKRRTRRAVLGIHELVAIADSLTVAPTMDFWAYDARQHPPKETFAHMETVLCDCIVSTLDIILHNKG